MKELTKIKLALIGVGNMGSAHVNSISELDNCELIAVCDIDKSKVESFVSDDNIQVFYDYKELLKWGEFDGLIIATPHYDHTVIAVEAFKFGYNVLTEKPVGVHVNDVIKMTNAWEEAKVKNPDVKFAAMFQQRTSGHWKKIKDLIESNELGKLVRTTWIITDWFRTQYYYDNGGWRATWKGEGGGVLLNQCPHQLDLFQWFVGMPDKVTGFASIGKYHNIEVEDEVTAYMQYKNGMVGHFITSTGESPGTNRLEIVGEQGKLIYENNKLTFFRNRDSMLERLKTSQVHFDHCETWEIDIPCEKEQWNLHQSVIKNFAEAIAGREKLIAPAIEGINSVSLSNAIMLSQFTDSTVSLPIDGDVFEEKLQGLIKNSTFVKTKVESSGAVSDMSKSF